MALTAFLREVMVDRGVAVTCAGAVVLPPSIWFMMRCLAHRREPWDTAAFAMQIGAVFAAIWMIVESLLNVGNPPGHWRIYIVFLSLGLLHHALAKCRDMWLGTRAPPMKCE
jgi:hypothetical protein